MFRIKRRFLNKNQIGKYLAYAVGEIILVVIGILIPVLLNNCNDQRKRQKEINDALRIVAQDMVSDTLEAHRILDFYEDRAPIFLRVMKDSLTQDDVDSCTACNIITRVKLFTLARRGIQRLRELSGTTGNDSLPAEIIQFYTSIEVDLNNFENKVYDDVLNNLSDWKNPPGLAAFC